MRSALVLPALAGLLGVAPPASVAQQSPGGAPPAARDSLQLGVVLEEALRADPRSGQLQLHAARTELRLRNLATERLPVLTAEGLAQYQSDVTEVPLTLPGGQSPPTPAKDTYDAWLGIEQSIFDPSLSPRRAVERAQLAESHARVRTTLFGLRQEVDEAFFTAALLQERFAVLAATIGDLEQRSREAAVRVREGAALPSDTTAVQATLLQRRQDQVEVQAGRRAALARLAELTRRRIAEDAVFVLPDLAQTAVRARGALADLRQRPEYRQFASTRERLERQEDVVSAEGRPRVSAFGRLGYGRPGLDALSNSFDAYWVGGIQVRWTPWTWGATRRDREALAIERRIVAADEAAFTDGLRRGVQEDLAAIDRLDSTLAMDERIIQLREQIERENRLRFQEGVVTAAEYLDRSTDVLEARLARAAHRVEQAQARARLLTTLGMEIR
ncbi:MAG: TolC family protein [Gemmatimonadales bacterium]